MVENSQPVHQRWGLWDVVITLGGALVLAVTSAFVLAALAAPLAWQILIGGTMPWVALGSGAMGRALT